MYKLLLFTRRAIIASSITACLYSVLILYLRGGLEGNQAITALCGWMIGVLAWEVYICVLVSFTNLFRNP